MNPVKSREEKEGVPAAKSPYEEHTELQVKAAFEVFDEDQNGRAKLKHLGTILRALGRVLTKEEVRVIQEKLEDPEYSKYMRLDDLLPVATKLLLHDKYKAASVTSLLQAFRKLDRLNKGCIDADYWRKVFKEHGDNIDEKIIEKCFADFDQDDARRIHYEEICEKLTVPRYFDITDNRRRIRLELSGESARIT